MEVLLATMTIPTQSLAQELERDEHIKRINDMTLGANTDLLDAGAEYKDDIDATKINDFRISIANIERRTSNIFVGLCTWKASNTSTPVRTYIHRTAWTSTGMLRSDCAAGSTPQRSS